MAFQVASSAIGQFGPYLLESTHLFSRDRLGATGRDLEEIGEIFDNNTCKQVSPSPTVV